MKKILITGKSSYIGNKFEEWVKDYKEDYKLEKLSMRDGSWRNKDFSQYDVVFHVAGIAHVSTAQNMEETYYKINRDLTIECAEKAKAEGVKQFVFLSSIIVYGSSSKIGETKSINENTPTNPSDFYGKSKLQAEEGILSLIDDNFKVVVLRPPMVYGKGSKGNYLKLAKAAQILPIFPDIDNQRSMIHIDNLCEFTKLVIENEENGIFHPQNRQYVKTSEMVRLIAKVHNRRIMLIKIFNGSIKLIGAKVGILNKVFGNLVYDQAISEYKDDYYIRNLMESVRHTECSIEGIERTWKNIF